ncbi:ABC-type Fe3+ transport system, permease component [Halalkaliarchaeum sp. AArc-CO]|uniref:ABC transporter permease n=1 Tax=unclassified Halalkaliarchaeum TaxID=2678344 RepID=UPI00217D9651|nr:MULTISPECIES: iron ABC transporter permease [unclassified Halalkaliarchaeum]MDR5672480.1 iron ABC transporter permease [Halalkaliarchaeum sp. AArc-GB]UWG50570.1 ABC-type Fe3+ transport system, permease component [Halalkaliarchaeum sp. AArc-CO]
MGVTETESGTTGATDGGPDARQVGLTFLSGAIAAAMLLPVSWILLRAASVNLDRAAGIVFRARTVEIAFNSLLLMGVVTGLSVLIGVPLAYLTVRTDLPFRRFWTIAVALPLAVPSYLGAFAFIAVFSPRGQLQSLLEPFGVEAVPSIYGLHGAILIITLYTYPYVYLTTRAALKTFDTSLVEAARMLNHGRWETFKRVTFPHVRPAVVAGALLVALYAVSDFGTPAFLQAEVFTRQIYLEHRSLGGGDYAAFLSLQLVVLTVFILALESRIRGDETMHGDTARAGTHRISLGRWKWVGMAACAAIVFFTIVLPVGVFLQWLATSQADVPASFQFQLEYVVNSVSVSLAAAVVAGLAALPVAYLATQYDSRLGFLFERATYVGYAVPGIVIGLALVFFGANYGGLLYQSIPILVFAYVVRFIPQSVGSTRTSMLQVDPKLVEASRSLGRSSTATFREVTLPLIAPGVVAGAALVFLTTMKELPATLLLRPTGFETLVTRIWAAESAGLHGYAAIPALILVVVSGLSMVVILRQEGYTEE